MALIMAFTLAVMLIAGHGSHYSNPESPPAAPQYIERGDPGDAARDE